MKLKKLLAGLVALTCVFATTIPCVLNLSVHAEDTNEIMNEIMNEYTYENLIYRRSPSISSTNVNFLLSVIGVVDGATDITIPEEINGEKVVSIKEEAFKDCESLVSVSIPDTVTTIGKNTFQNCINLKQVRLPENMNIYYIPVNMFDGCTSLEKITIPEKITSIGMEAFQNCTSLSEIQLPENLNTIQNRAFRGCTSLESIQLPEGLKNLSSGIFWDCENLKNINIPDNIETIETGAFENCTSLENISFSQNVTSIHGHAFENTAWLNNQPDGAVYINDFLYCYKGKLTESTEFIIPEDVKYIVDSAFANQENLISVTMPESLETIGSYAFANCENLEKINFSHDLKEVSEYAFHDTAWLNQQEDGVIYAGNYALLYKGEFPEQAEITLRDGTTVINPNLFAKNTNLVSITLPEGFKMLYSESFLDCANLSNITVPDSIEMIGGDAFTGTAWLENQPDGLIYIGNVAYFYKGTMPENTEIILENNTVSISPYAFATATNLTAITLPEGLKDIGAYAFAGCKNLASVTIPESVETIGSPYFSTRLIAIARLDDFVLTVLNPDCKFLNIYTFPYAKSATIKGYENSTAQTYAEKNNFNFESLGEIPDTPEILLLGDVNFDNSVDILDVIALNKAILGQKILTDKQIKVIDFNQDNIADPTDSLTLMKYIVKLITEDELLLN